MKKEFDNIFSAYGYKVKDVKKVDELDCSDTQIIKIYDFFGNYMLKKHMLLDDFQNVLLKNSKDLEDCVDEKELKKKVNI